MSDTVEAAVEAYIAQHSLDERCAEKLKRLAPAVQLQVMQTDVSAARNVSAVVSSNIQKALNPIGAGEPPRPSCAPVSLAPAAPPMSVPQLAIAPQYAPPDDLLQPVVQLVEAYIAQHSLDERCAEKLKALPPTLQLQVMQTDVSAARNVSAVVSTNIQKAVREGPSLSVPLGASEPPQLSCAPVSLALAAQPMSMPMPQMALAPQYIPAKPLVQPVAQPGAAEAFIAYHSLDERCAEKLKALAPAVQLQVMQMDVSAARNVSAVVSTNIQKAVREGPSLSVPLGASQPPQLSCAPVSLALAAQPMSMPMPQLALAPQYIPAKPLVQPVVQPGVVEAYIAQHSLDARCAEKLKALAPAAQLQVMQTDVSSARNVSAVVSSNIQKASTGSLLVTTGDAAYARPEYMLQQPAMMLQPAMLQPAMPQRATQQSMPFTHGPVGQGRVDMALLGAVDAYIMQHKLDERCAAKLRALPLLSQLQVMQTDVSAARNVSAVVSALCNTIPPPDPVEAYIAEHRLDDRCAAQLRALEPAEQSQVMATDISAARNPSAVVSSNIQKAAGRSGTKRARDEEMA
jgi:predicted HD phosphohydrolase